MGGAAALPVLAAAAAAAEEAGKPAMPLVLGPGPVPFTLQVNGKSHDLKLEPRVTLLDALRFHCGTTGPKEVCDRGSCGSCAVLLDGVPVVSCMVLAVEAAGRTITTTEGLCGPDGKPHPLHEAFARCDALQCGFCTPGMVTSCAALLARNPDPTADDVRDAISGNLCRCGTYPRVVQACREAAAAMKGGK
jgi:aerobic-type carbon monoxide dehydrogenase small subunit (CoxS/CutS family)